MAQPFLAAGLPGLTFGLSLGRGLSIQLDPGEVVDQQDHSPEEFDCFTKNVTTPSGMLVVHLHALHELVISVFEQPCEEIYLYAVFSLASVTKTTAPVAYNLHKFTSVYFNEIKYIPFLLGPKWSMEMNKLVITILACRFGEEHANTKAKHKLVARCEMHLHNILKNNRFTGTRNLTTRNGVVGEMHMECAALYGDFGYGQSFQVRNKINEPEDMVKSSLLPRLIPEDHILRGSRVHPRKLLHPSFVPLIGQAEENLEPDISGAKELLAMKCPNFPLLKKHLNRLNQLKNQYATQNSRTKRISFLKQMLQAPMTAPMEETIDGTKEEEPTDKPAPTSPTLALMMNATKAPDLVRKKRTGTPRGSIVPQGDKPDQPSTSSAPSTVAVPRMDK